MTGAPDLPRARDAVIPADELVSHTLIPIIRRGRHKALVFRSALGTGPDEWRYLRSMQAPAGGR